MSTEATTSGAKTMSISHRGHRVVGMATMIGMIVAATPGLGAQEVGATAQLPGADRDLAASVQEMFSVGTLSGEDHEIFSGVRGLSFDAEGNLYVLDGDNFRVVIYSPDGQFQRSIGSQGEGPGELQFPVAMTVLEDGRVAVYDMARQSVSAFMPDGSYEGSYPIASRIGLGADFTSIAGNSVMFLGSQLPAPSFDGPEPDYSNIPDNVPALRVSLDGRNGESEVTRIPAPPLTVNASGDANNRNISLQRPPTFTAATRWTALPDGSVAFAEGDGYLVRVVGADGSPYHTLVRPLGPRPVSEADRDMAREESAERMRTGEGMVSVDASDNGSGVQRRYQTGAALAMQEEQIQRRLSEMTFAESLPAVRSLVADPAGNLWVVRETDPALADGGPIDLLRPEGQYMGTINGVAVPDAFGPDGLVAYLERDEEWGFERVRVARLSIAAR